VARGNALIARNARLYKRDGVVLEESEIGAPFGARIQLRVGLHLDSKPQDQLMEEEFEEGGVEVSPKSCQ
jgi:hypothetical protein